MRRGAEQMTDVDVRMREAAARVFQGDDRLQIGAKLMYTTTYTPSCH